MTAYATTLANSVDSAPRVRLAAASSMQHAGGALNARSGLRPDNGGAVTVVAGTMGVSVAPFSGWIDGGASDAQGGYPFVSDAAVTLTLADGHATLARTDTIVARVRDDTFDGSGSTDATVAVIAGTPGAGVPTLPATCVPLRDVVVPAGLSAGTGGLSGSNLGADRRAWTVAAGGVLPVASSTARDALGAKAGQAVYRLDTKTVQVFNGTSWDTFKRDDGLLIQRGMVSATSAVSAGGNGDVTLTFPTPFSGAPSVGLTSRYQWVIVSQAGDASTTSVTVRFRNLHGSSSFTPDATWIAIGNA